MPPDPINWSRGDPPLSQEIMWETLGCEVFDTFYFYSLKTFSVKVILAVFILCWPTVTHQEGKYDQICFSLNLCFCV